MLLRKEMVVPDVHRPFHSRKGWRVMVNVAEGWKPDGCTITGDFVDCLAVSFHERNLARRHDLAWEIEDANAGLDELDAALGSKCEKRFVMGNHEYRLERYIAQKAAELFPFVKLEQLLRLKERGWKVTPYRQYVQVGKLKVSHEYGNAGPTAHVKAMADVLGNAVIGHTHHLGVDYTGNAVGESHVGASFGWLGDVEQVDYMHRAKANRNWHLGFGIARLEPDGTAHIQAIPIIKGRCVVEGRLYSAALKSVRRAA